MIRQEKDPIWILKGLLLMCLFIVNNAYAQDNKPDFFHRYPTAIKLKAIDTTATSARVYPMAVGISAGTQAFIGADFTVRLHQKVNARVAYHYLTYTFDETVVDFNSADLLLNAKFEQSNIAIFGEYNIAKDRFRLVAWISYAPDNMINFSGILADSIQFQDVLASPEEIGLLGGTIQMGNKIAPYFGIGVGRAIPLKRVGLSADFGTYYKGSPQVELMATNLLRNNVNNEQIIEDAIDFIQWWPVLSVRLAVRID
ncbi:MAG: hypothetical protein AAF705_15270 [Bacteroidota bacterium]